MPCRSSRFDPSVGPLIQIGISEAGVEPSASPNRVRNYSALIDTGAQVTCIAPSVAQDLGLRPFGKRPMVSAHEARPANCYFVDLLVHFDVLVPFRQTTVVEFNRPASASFEMLLGRDLLCKGSFFMSPDGRYTFCL